MSKFSIRLDSEYEELETTPRYRPDSLNALSRTTRFSEDEIKRIYRGFKAECPSGVVKEDAFKIIYSQFFPQGGLYPLLFLFSPLNAIIVHFFKFLDGKWNIQKQSSVSSNHF